MHIENQTRLVLLLQAVDAMIEEREASPGPHVREEIEILVVFRAQLVAQMHGEAA